MEPENLNSPAPDDEQLEARLRRSAAPLPDDGFSLRVMAALPPRPPAAAPPTPAPDRARMMVFLTGGVCGAIVALGGMALKQGSGAVLTDSLRGLRESLVVLADPRFALALGVALSSLLYVFRPAADRRRIGRL